MNKNWRAIAAIADTKRKMAIVYERDENTLSTMQVAAPELFTNKVAAENPIPLSLVKFALEHEDNNQHGFLLDWLFTDEMVNINSYAPDQILLSGDKIRVDEDGGRNYSLWDLQTGEDPLWVELLGFSFLVWFYESFDGHSETLQLIRPKIIDLHS